MNEIGFDSIEAEWGKLLPSEKSLCLNYARQLRANVSPSNKMILAVNDIHSRHEDFHMGCIPCGLYAMTNDLSGYEPKDIA